MYCVMETQFYCTGNAEHCAGKFNAMLGDLKAMLERHPCVTCTAFDEGECSLSPADLEEHAETNAELDAKVAADGE